jgi:hypothetical protein
MSNTDHTARPESWGYITRHDSINPYADCLMELLARVERLEQAQQQPEPQDNQTLHTIALRMVDGLERLDVLPEIQATIRRAIREPMAQPAPSTPAGLVSDVAALIARFASTSRAGDDCTPCAEQVILAVAHWLIGKGYVHAADLLHREVGR